MPAAETARLIASLELQDKNFTRGLKQVERGVGRVDKKLGAFSGAINRTAIRAIDNLVARAADVPGAVINAAVEQETAITGIAKTINGDISGIVDDLKRLSTETGSTFGELAGIAELGGAMGIAKDDIAAFGEQVAILGATTDVSVEDAATSLGQLGNVIGLTGDEFDNFAASLVDLGNKGESTEAQILEITKRAGLSAKLFGIGKAETLGWASAVANLGLEAEAGGTALGSLFQKSLPLFLKGNKTIQKVTGKTAKELKQAFEKDASGALRAFITDLSELSEGERLAAIQKLYGKNSALTKILLGLTDDTNNLTDSVKVGTEAWKEATAAQEEADKRFATSEFAFKRLNNSIGLMAATVGTELLPVLTGLAEEGIAWLNEPATQKNLKNFAKGLGEGVRGLAGILRSIDWGSIAGFLGTAAGFAGELVGWFTKMPGWAQAFLVGGFAATKLPLIGDFLSEAAKGLVKGVLGINAGVVNVNARAVSGAGGAAAAGGGASKLMSAVRIVGAVTIAGASIIALAEAFKGFATGVQENQDDLQEKVNRTNTQGFKETIANLQSVTTSFQAMPIWDQLLAVTTGGAQLTQNFEQAADRIVAQFKAGQLDPSELRTALAALTATETEFGGVLELPKTDSAISTLTEAIRRIPVSDPKEPTTKPQTVTIKPGDQMFSLFATQQQATKNSIENAKTIASRENAATNAAVDDLRADNAAKQAANKAAIERARAATVAAEQNTKLAAQTAGIRAAGAARSAGATTSGAIRGVGANIVSAIYAARPIIQPTNVIEKYTTIVRTGSTSGSRRSGPLE